MFLTIWMLELELLVELATVHVFWVALEAQRGAEVADARLDAGPVPVVAGGGVVDEVHLLMKHGTSWWAGMSEQLAQSPNQPFPFMAPQCGRVGR